MALALLSTSVPLEATQMLGEWQFVLDFSENSASSFDFYGDILVFDQYQFDSPTNRWYYEGCRAENSEDGGCTQSALAFHGAAGFYDNASGLQAIVVDDSQPIVPLVNPAENRQSREILFRMLDPEGVARGPQDIVRTAERYGLMDAVDQWVIRRTLRTLGSMRAELDAVDHYAINLSATSLRQETLLDLIHSELDQSGVPPTKICFEVTETAAVENLAEARWLMQELGSIGCSFSLDDFGTGMASYAYLRDLRVNYIKIDRSFVRDVDHSALSSAIVESIHQISALIGARTVAEGVETQAIADKLTVLGLDFAQGYLFGRPAPLRRV